jgi:hypothetical protein
MCIVGERGAIFAGSNTLSDGSMFIAGNDGVGAISRDGRYSAAGSDIQLYDGRAFQTVGNGVTAIGATGVRAYVVGDTSPTGFAATATAVSINDHGFASFISNRPGS